MNYVILIIAGVCGMVVGSYLGKRRKTLLLRRSADSDGQGKNVKAKEKEEKEKIN